MKAFENCEVAHHEFEDFKKTYDVKRTALTAARERVWKIIGPPPLPRFGKLPVYAVLFVLAWVAIGFAFVIANGAAIIVGSVFAIGLLWFADKYFDIDFRRRFPGPR